MITVNFGDSHKGQALGLTQWDYGQTLRFYHKSIDIPDGTEAQFYQGTESSLGYIQENQVGIPDAMLQNTKPIILYIYVRADESGETILSVVMKIKPRPKPSSYVMEGYKEYLRLLPSGGTEGQVLTKVSDTDYDAEWKDNSADSALDPEDEMTDEDVDTICV